VSVTRSPSVAAAIAASTRGRSGPAPTSVRRKSWPASRSFAEVHVQVAQALAAHPAYAISALMA
jgi:hypothetical protein